MEINRRSFLSLLAAAALPAPRSAPLRDGAAAAADAPDALTAVLATMRPGSWGTAPDTALLPHCYERDTGAADYNPRVARDNNGDVGCNAILQTWAGAVHDTISGRSIHTAGGHLAYNGNELYAFNFGALTWERLDTPDDFGTYQEPNAQNPSNFPNGDPYSGGHTYGMLCFVPGKGPRGSLMVWGAGGASDHTQGCVQSKLPSGLLCSGIYFYDLGKPTLAKLGHATQLGIPGSGWSMTNPQSGFAYFGAGLITGYDPVLNRVVRLSNDGNNPSAFYDIATDKISPTRGGGTQGGLLSNYTMSGKVRGKHRELWCFGGQGSQGNPLDTGVVRASLVNGNTDNIKLIGTPRAIAAVAGPAYPAVEYHAPTDKFVLWTGASVWTGSDWGCDHANPNSLYIVDPAALTVKEHPAGGTQMPCDSFFKNMGVPGGQTAGNMGKFFYDAPHNCFIGPWVTAWNVFIYKPDF